MQQQSVILDTKQFISTVAAFTLASQSSVTGVVVCMLRSKIRYTTTIIHDQFGNSVTSEFEVKSWPHSS